MKNNVLSWIFFLPAAILGSLIAVKVLEFINFLSFKLMGGSSDGWLPKFIESLSTGVVLGGVFVFIGAIIVPKYKKQIALLLVGLITLTVVFFYVMSLSTMSTETKVFGFIFAFSVLGGSYRASVFFNEDSDY